MDAIGKSETLFHDVSDNYVLSGEDKFKIVSCPVKKIHCAKILPEVNELYARSELARINKEYLQSAVLLQNAYLKTLQLQESCCGQCVNLIQSSISETLDTIQEEVRERTYGLFHKKRYEHVYARLSSLVKKIGLFNPGEVNVFSTGKSSPVGADL